MIPKIIHNIWIQGYEHLPEKNKQNHNDIKKLNPDWEFIVWDKKMILQLLQNYPKLLSLYKKVDQLSGVIHSKVTQSDIARYVILKEYGGLYYDIDYECISSFNELFRGTNTTNKTVYIASSTFDLFEYLRSLGNVPSYCSCFMAFQKAHPIWDKVFKKIENTTSKYVIAQAVDQVLQENIYPVVILDRVGDKYVCSYEKTCFISKETSGNYFQNYIRFFHCYYKKIFLFLLVFLIIFIVERVNHFNIMNFGFPSFIPGIGIPQQQQTSVQHSNSIKNKSKQKSKK